MTGVLAPLVVAWVALALGALGAVVGRPIWRRLELDALEHAVFSVLVGGLVVGIAVWIVGYFRYDAWTMAAILLIASAAGFAGTGDLRRWTSAARASLPEGYWRAFPAACAVLLAFAAIGCYAPPSDHDTLRYQLLLPMRDLAWGRIDVYYGWSVYEFLPPLGSMLNRLAYALGGTPALELANVAWQAAAAATAAALTRRLGGALGPQWLAACLLLAQRVSINLASAASTEFALAAYAGGALLAAFALLGRPSVAAGVLLGLAAGGSALSKTLGLAYGAGIGVALILFAVRRPGLLRPLAVAAAVGMLVILPWLIRNGAVTGNPLFPSINAQFGADRIEIFDDMVKTMGFQTTLTGGLRLPWDMFVNQMAFDGLQFGLPLFLILIPFALLSERRRALALPAIAVAVYLAVWWVERLHLLRFTVVLFPALAALAAVGGAEVASAARRQGGALAAAALFVGAALAAGQAGFLGATVWRRVPPALGLEPAASYLAQDAFRYYAQYDACTWTAGRVKPGERYLALLNDPTAYCPPEKAFPQLLPGDAERMYTRAPLHAVSPAWLAAAMRLCNVRYVVKAANIGNDAELLKFAKHRYDALLVPVLAKLRPVHAGRVAAVYRGSDVAAALDGIAAGAAPAATDPPLTPAICDYPRR